MEQPGWIPGGIDIERPSMARIYDYWLGGFHNFAVDREVARQVVEAVPDTPLIMQANRAFLHRAVSYLVDAGIHQFLDIGSGIPTLGNVHEVAQRRAPDAHVVYVDIDPVVVAYGRHILGDNEHVTVIQEDLRRPSHIMAHPDVRRLLDFDQPMAVSTLAVLHFIADADDPPSILARLRDAVAPGSYLVLSHGTVDAMQGKAERPLELLSRTSTPPISRTRTEIERFFAGFDLVEPGLVWAPQWRPEDPEDVGDHPERSANYVGVGCKP